MSEAWIYISAAAFFIAVFPIHVFNYVYVSTGERYASYNLTLFRYIPVINVNTVKNSLNKMTVNGKEKQVDTSFFKSNALKIFNNLSIVKIIQLGDYGILDSKNVYAALAQNALTNAAYAFVRMNGGKVKLRNYAVLNYEHDKINYYLKVVGIINIISISKLAAILFWEKINERKNKKVAKKQSV